jgi:pimeloyl-ACP methyl ester carboxylesterase
VVEGAPWSNPNDELAFHAVFMLDRLLQLVPGVARQPQRDTYFRTSPLILINGLAEQSESWYHNRANWQQHFEVHTPGILVYDGPILQQRLAGQLPISVAYLKERLAEYLEKFVQTPPYHLIASSLGAQIAVEYASERPETIDRLVLICPSGMGSDERLPIFAGARHKDYRGLVESTFHDSRLVSSNVISYYEQKFKSKAWRKALFETVRGTKSHSIRQRLSAIDRPVLVICGKEDRIVDTHVIQEAVAPLANYQCVTIANCGHAPQLERPEIVNRLTTDFLQGQSSPDTADTTWSAPDLVSAQT